MSRQLGFTRYVIRDVSHPWYIGNSYRWKPRGEATIFTTYEDALSVRFALLVEGRDGIIETVHVLFPEYRPDADLPSSRPE